MRFAPTTVCRRTPCREPIVPSVYHKSTNKSAWYWRIKQKKGARKAIVALARKLLVIIYTMLKQGTNFDENCFEVRRKNCEQKQLSRYIRELEKHGYTVEAQV